MLFNKSIAIGWTTGVRFSIMRATKSTSVCDDGSSLEWRIQTKSYASANMRDKRPPEPSNKTSTHAFGE